METLNLMQHAVPALVVAAAALPWATALAMEAFSAMTSDRLDDAWRSRAAAAQRWNRTERAVAQSRHALAA